MNKRTKVILGSVFAVLIAAVAIVAILLNQKTTAQGGKEFEVTITSERDGYSKTTTCHSEEEYLGTFIRTFEGCEFEESDYGIYIKGFQGMMEDMDNQYWWCVLVNGESATTGADEIPLQDGDNYCFTLKQGW